MLLSRPLAVTPRRRLSHARQAECVREHAGPVNLLKWLYRLPGRINRSFDSTAAATNVGSPGMLTSDVSAIGARVVREEVAEATAAETEDAEADDTDQPADPARLLKLRTHSL